jgi:DNA primase
MGAANFDKVDVRPLAGARVIAIPDRDEAGQKWARQVRDKLDGVAAALIFKLAKTGKDAADHIAAEHGVDDLVDTELPNNEDDQQGKRQLVLTPAA